MLKGWRLQSSVVLVLLCVSEPRKALRDQDVSLCSPGSSEAGGQGASGGWADGARYRDAGERPGGAEEEGPRDWSTPPKWGQRPLFTGELKKLGDDTEMNRGVRTEQLRMNESVVEKQPLLFSNSGKGCWALFSTHLLLFLTQAAPLLCVPLATGWHNRGVGLPEEAFGGARRALSQLRSRVEDVCREEADQIGRAGVERRNPPRKINLKLSDVKNAPSLLHYF